MDIRQAAATLAAAAAVAGTAALTACTPERHAPQPSQYRYNPAPQQRYELTMTLANAPGRFGVMGADAYYGARNCGYYVVPEVQGGINWPKYEKAIELVQVSDTEWKGIFYADAMLDEDYGSGGGVCHWEFDEAQAVGAYLSASGARTDTGFIANLPRKEFLEGKTVTFYFNRHWYPGNPDDATANGDVFRGDVRSSYGPSITDADLFTLTLSTRKAS